MQQNDNKNKLCKKKDLTYFCLQKTEIPKGYDINLFNIPDFKLKCLMKFNLTKLDQSDIFVKISLIKSTLKKKALMLFF